MKIMLNTGPFAFVQAPPSDVSTSKPAGIVRPAHVGVPLSGGGDDPPSSTGTIADMSILGAEPDETGVQPPENLTAKEAKALRQRLGLPAKLPRLPGPAPARLPRVAPPRQKEQVREALAGTGFDAREITRADGKPDAIINTVETPLGRVNVTKSMIGHVVEGKSDHREQFLNRVLPALQDPAEVWLSKRAVKGREVEWYKFLTAWEGEDGAPDGALVVTQKDAREGLLSWTFYRVKGNQAINNRRKEALVYQRGRQ